MNKTNRNVLIIAFIAVIILIGEYANHFNNGFHFDDSHAVVSNVYIRDLKNIPAFFSDPKMFSADPSHWGLRSVVTTTLAIDYWLGDGLYPFWFQMSTFIWHILLCVMLFFLYRSILKTSYSNYLASYLAIAAAAIYGLHKINAETLNYIIARSDVLSTFFIILSLFIYIQWPAKRKYCLYIIPAFIGVFAKETIPVLVIILFFYILIFERKLSIGDLFRAKNFRSILKTIWQIMPLIVVVVVTQLYTLSRISSIPGISNPLLPYLLTQSYVWVHYFLNFFIPLNVSADSDWKIINNVFDERIIIGCIFIVTLVVTIFKTSAKEKSRPIAFGLIWFAAALLPTSLAPFAEVTNDHRMYFPFIGLALSIITYAGVLFERYRDIFTDKRYLIGFSVLLLVVLSLNAYGVFERNKVWKDEESLWHDVTIKSPTNGRGLMNYGLTQMDKANYVVAGYYYKKAKFYIPDYSALYINMGILDGAVHQPQEADQNFRRAIALSPDDFNSYLYYGRVLLNYGFIKDAQRMLETAIKLNPYSEATLNLLMSVYNELGQWQQLKQTSLQLLSILPNDEAAKVYLRAAQSNIPAISSEDEPGAHLPMSAADYLNMSLIYYNSGMYVKCISECTQALKLKPDYADAYSNIGAAYIKLKMWDKSIEASKKALQLNPNHKLAARNLKMAESMLK